MPDRDERIAALFRAWDSRATPGCAVGIVEDGRLVFARGFGMADLEHDIPSSPSTVFHVASLSKQFTAFLVVLLACDGKLALDDDIRSYLPELPDYGYRISLRHLIHHTSGLRDQWDLLSLAGWRGDDVVTNGDVLDLAVRQRSLEFRPGDEYQYCNTGYTFLGLIVERVTGQPLRAVADAQIFHPLGMTQTHFRDDHTSLVTNRAFGYVPKDGGGYRLGIPAFDTVGATSLFTTVEDLARWVGNLLNPRIGGSELVEQLLTPGTLNDGSPLRYAFGVELNTYRGLRTVSHAGGDAGYRAYLVWFPDQRFAVAVLGNVSTLLQPSGTPAYQVADVYLASQLAPLPAPPSLRRLSREDLVGKAGIFWDEAAGKLRKIEVGEKGLRVPVWPGYAYDLAAVDGDRFTVPDELIAFIFAGLSSQPAELREALDGRVTRTYRRVPAIEIGEDQLDEYVGRYRSDEVGTTWLICQRAKKLIVQRPKHADETLLPTFADGFTLGGGDPAVVLLFQRDDQNHVDGFTLSTFSLRHLAFRRVPESGAGNRDMAILPTARR